MNYVQFDEGTEFHMRSARLLGQPETPTMIRVLLKSGLAKNEKQALFILLGLLILLLASTLLLYRTQIRDKSVEQIIAPDGTRYSVEEYFELVGQGRNPLEQRPQ